ncbi:hypothetical protein [Pedobacter gandavensis]|uniref:hypothetical protein n=1 Tax=Pedobacter gandavensis TaxID=2679963 RepID=UPI00293123D6|nr:hypothetical protein [Pedobacter gandavensis]
MNINLLKENQLKEKKLSILVLLLLLSPVIGFAQFFEGTITYSNSYKSKSPQLKDEQLNEIMGTTQEYFIKGGDYKSIMNGSFLKMQLYRSTENRSYMLTGNSDIVYWEDYSKNKDVAIKYEVQKSKEIIMGIPCDVLVVYTPKSKSYYYFNKKYAVNPELFKQHIYGNWYYIISRTKALPLKTVYEDDQFVLTSTAIDITPKKLNANVFELSDKDKITPATW